jgi:hypothetical protein
MRKYLVLMFCMFFIASFVACKKKLLKAPAPEIDPSVLGSPVPDSEQIANAPSPSSDGSGLSPSSPLSATPLVLNIGDTLTIEKTELIDNGCMVKFKNKPEELRMLFNAGGEKKVFLAKLYDGRDLYIYAMVNNIGYNYSIYIYICIGNQPSSDKICFFFKNATPQKMLECAYIMSTIFNDSSCLSSMTLQRDSNNGKMYFNSEVKSESEV